MDEAFIFSPSSTVHIYFHFLSEWLRKSRPSSTNTSMSLTIKFKTIQPYLTFEAVVGKNFQCWRSVCLKRSLIEGCFTVYIIFGLVISNLFYLDFTWLHSFIRAQSCNCHHYFWLAGAPWCLPHFIIKSSSNSTLFHTMLCCLKSEASEIYKTEKAFLWADRLEFYLSRLLFAIAPRSNSQTLLMLFRLIRGGCRLSFNALTRLSSV